MGSTSLSDYDIKEAFMPEYLEFEWIFMLTWRKGVLGSNIRSQNILGGKHDEDLVK